MSISRGFDSYFNRSHARLDMSPAASTTSWGSVSPGQPRPVCADAKEMKARTTIPTHFGQVLDHVCALENLFAHGILWVCMSKPSQRAMNGGIRGVARSD
jgi:hypothetical protein